MTQDNLSSLRFSIEESVWFQKGQEVSELLSISLDPDISIEEYEQYVSIRGSLLLTGEYKAIEEEGQSLREYMSGKQVQDVMYREDGLTEFRHRFPLDITIPKNRIGNIEDVYVSIDSFDYDLPLQNSLELTADLIIAGLYGEQQSVARVEEEQAQEEQPTLEEMIEFEPLYRRNVLEEEEHERPEETEVYTEDDPEPLSQEEKLYEPFEVEAKKENVPKEEEESYALPKYEMRPKNVISLWDEEEKAEEYTREEAYENFARLPKTREQKHEEAVEKEEKMEKVIRKENALYLTKLFSKNEDEEFLKLRMCIVQNGDSLEKIAERYNLNVQQIIRLNNIENPHELEEGALLTLPTSSR